MTLFGSVAELEPDGVPGPPGMPLGHRIELPGRGTTFVREVEGPPGAPTVVLLHGWIASAGLNWFQVFGPLSEHFRVIAPDMRGHGRGIRSGRRFRLADCADDVAVLLDELGIDQAIVCGYSMGGPVAQLLWHRHPEKVAGLVLCATGQAIVPIMHQRVIFTITMAAIAGTTRLTQIITKMPRSWVRNIWPDPGERARPETLRKWAQAEIGRHNLRMLIEAGTASGSFSSRKWIGDIDVPTVALITTRDRAIGAVDQARMALNIPGAMIRRIEDGHLACASEQFGPILVDSCLELNEYIPQLRAVS